MATDWDTIHPGDPMPDLDHAMSGDPVCPARFGAGWMCTRRPHADRTHVATAGRGVLAVHRADGTVETRRSAREAASASATDETGHDHA